MNDTFFFLFYSFAHRSQILDWLIVFFAVYFPYIVVILAGFFLLFHHEVLRAESPARVFWEKKREILTVFISGGIAWSFAYILKNLIKSPRPFLFLSNVNALFTKSGFAFPSGHATFFSALAFSILFLHKKAGYVFLIFALFIGIARIVAGVHSPLDILGGLVLGFIISCLVEYFFKKKSRIS